MLPANNRPRYNHYKAPRVRETNRPTEPWPNREPMRLEYHLHGTTGVDRRMDSARRQLDLLLDLEARHDELLDRLSELDRQVEGVLCQWLADRQAVANSASPIEVPRLVDRPQEA